MQHDLVIDNQNGAAFLLDVQNALQALATCSSGDTPPTTPYSGQFWLDTSVAPNGYLRMRNPANDAWVDVAGVPAKALDADVLAGLVNVGYVTPKQVVKKQATQRILRNRILNPAMQISQENGDTAGTTSSYFAADLWRTSVSASGAAFTFARVASATPRGSKYRLRLAVTTAKPALGTSDFFVVTQWIEGARLADFRWGSAAAKPVILRFGFNGPAGTWCVALRSGAQDRSYIQTFSVAGADAGKDLEFVFAIPGSVTGTWATDNTAAIHLLFTFAAGTAAPGVEGWQDGSFIATVACTNGLQFVGNRFEIFDAGLYLDAEATGIPPLWQFPDEPNELLNCQRYFVISGVQFLKQATASTYGALASLPVDLRTVPTAAQITNISNSPAGVAASGTYQAYMPRSYQEVRTCVAGSVCNWGGINAINARM